MGAARANLSSKTEERAKKIVQTDGYVIESFSLSFKIDNNLEGVDYFGKKISLAKVRHHPLWQKVNLFSSSGYPVRSAALATTLKWALHLASKSRTVVVVACVTIFKRESNS